MGLTVMKKDFMVMAFVRQWDVVNRDSN